MSKKKENRPEYYVILTEGRTPLEIAQDLIALSKERLIIEKTRIQGDRKALAKLSNMAIGIAKTMQGLDEKTLQQVIKEINECRKEAAMRVKEEHGGVYGDFPAADTEKACNWVISVDIAEKKKQGRLRDRTFDELMKQGGMLTSYEMIEKYGAPQESEE
jgi:hypothetical protein